MVIRYAPTSDICPRSSIILKPSRIAALWEPEKPDQFQTTFLPKQRVKTVISVKMFRSPHISYEHKLCCCRLPVHQHPIHTYDIDNGSVSLETSEL